MLNPGGTRLNLAGDSGPRKTDDDLAIAASEAAGTRYKLLGELGRSEKAGVALLARDRELDALVILLLTREEASLFGKGAFASTILPELTDGVPISEVECPVCGLELTNWARLCANCWSDVSGLPASADPQCTPAELLADARRVARGAHTIVGHLTRCDGGGAVYFGRAVNSGRVSAFRLIDRRASAGDAPARTLVPIRELKLLELPDDSTPAEADAVATPRRGTPRASVGVAEPTPADGSFVIPHTWRPSRAQLFIGAAAIIVIAAVALLMNGDDSRGGGAAATESGPTSASSAAEGASAVPADSAEVFIGGEFPEGAVVTLNGVVLGNRRLVLAPGVYFLAATAPGYQPIDHRMSLTAGEEHLWTPRMEPALTESASASSARTRSVPRASTEGTRTSSIAGPAPGSRASCTTLYAAGRWDAAAQQCAREAEQGRSEAQLNTGLLYLHGRSAPRNDRLAATWLQRAAANGNPTAQYELGLLTEAGRGVPRSAREAAGLFLAAATAGHVNAQVKVGRAYEHGTGVRRDRAEAAKWYRAAIQQGNVVSRNYLGMLHIEGKGVRRDAVQGVALVRSAAEADELEAQANLGMLLASGRGVARNEAEAKEWLRRAAARGHKAAAQALRALEKKRS